MLFSCLFTHYYSQNLCFANSFMPPFLANFSFCFCPLSICERVHSLAAKIFCVCENVRPSLIQTKNGSSPLPFLPVFAFFCTFFAHFCTFSRRGQALLSARVHYMPKLKFAPFALFARFFIFPWARQKNVSIRFSHHSTFFCRCQHLCRKALHGRAR